MKASQFVLSTVKEKYSEYLEMAGDESPAMLEEILANLLYNEIQEKKYYKNSFYQLIKEIEELKNGPNPTK